MVSVDEDSPTKCKPGTIMSHRFGSHSQQGPKSAVQHCQHCCCCLPLLVGLASTDQPWSCLCECPLDKPQDTYLSRTARALLQLCTRLTILSRVVALLTFDLRAAYLPPPCVVVSAPGQTQGLESRV